MRKHPSGIHLPIVPPFRLKFPAGEITLYFNNPDLRKGRNQLVDFEDGINFLIIEKDERHNYLVFANYLLSICDVFKSFEK